MATAAAVGVAAFKPSTLSRDEFIATFGGIFEHSQWVAERAYDAGLSTSGEHDTIEGVHSTLVKAMRGASEEEKLTMLKIHPELAGKFHKARELTASSTSEHSVAGLDNLTDDEMSRFDTLNAEYNKKFQFPFIIALKDYTKSGVLYHFARRLENTREVEMENCLQQVERITCMRVAALFQAKAVEAAASATGGYLTTHVLDTARGCPAGGMRATLSLVNTGDGDGSDGVNGTLIFIKQFVTNSDGRVDGGPILRDDEFRCRTYELVFHVGEYYRQCMASSPPRPFLDRVPIRFSITEGGEHYHVPLLVSPFGYSTYRGS